MDTATRQRHVRWGKQIRACRVSQNLTQFQLGELAGVGQGTVANWEAGRWSPREEHKSLLAGIFSLDVNFLFPVERNEVAS